MVQLRLELYALGAASLPPSSASPCAVWEQPSPARPSCALRAEQISNAETSYSPAPSGRHNPPRSLQPLPQVDSKSRCSHRARPGRPRGHGREPKAPRKSQRIASGPPLSGLRSRWTPYGHSIAEPDTGDCESWSSPEAGQRGTALPAGPAQPDDPGVAAPPCPPGTARMPSPAPP